MRYEQQWKGGNYSPVEGKRREVPFVTGVRLCVTDEESAVPGCSSVSIFLLDHAKFEKLCNI